MVEAQRAKGDEEMKDERSRGESYKLRKRGIIEGGAEAGCDDEFSVGFSFLPFFQALELGVRCGP